ncbi:MAG TPA: hypothetical protein VHO70_20880 [Chitinispirillaceae bacterium]|nr:hypothetical protein [Chitinispirillaceae bacterium]
MSISIVAQSENSYRKRLFPVCFAIIALISFLIRAKNLFLGSSFWWDEAMLADNIINRNFIELLKPLQWFQVAPPGYLWITKLIASVTGYSDIGFRLVSFLTGISIPPLFFLLLYGISKNLPVSFALSFAACVNPYLLYYSTELKPYILDVFLGVVILLLHHFKETSLIKRFYTPILLSFFVFGGLFFSYYFIIAASLIVYHCIIVKWSLLKKCLVTGFALIMTGLTFLFLAYHHPHSEFMNTFWQSEFVNLSGGLVSAGKSLGSKVLISIQELFGLKQPKLLLVVIIFFSIFLFFKRPKSLFWLALPVVIHIGLALLQKYPITSRLELLWLVNIFYLFAISLSNIKKPLIKYSALIIIIFLAIPWGDIPEFFLNPPITKCYFLQNFKKIPDHSTVYISESLVPAFNVESRRGTLPDTGSLDLIKGSARIKKTASTSQTYGVAFNKDCTIAEEIRSIAKPDFFVMLHLYNRYDIDTLFQELNFNGNVDTMFCKPVLNAGGLLTDMVLHLKRNP